MKKVFFVGAFVFALFWLAGKAGLLGGTRSADNQPIFVHVSSEEAAPLSFQEETVTPTPETTPLSLKGVEILTEEGKWVSLTTPDPRDCKVEAKRERWYGLGPSYQLRFDRAGLVVEKYVDYCISRDPETYDCLRKETVTLQNLQVVTAGKPVRVMEAASVFLDGQLVFQEKFCTPQISPQEIFDPEWTPSKIEKEFSSIKELRDFAEKTRSWMVIASSKAAPLLGWKYQDLKVYKLTMNRTFLVFSFDMSDEDLDLGQWQSAHVKYRYLGILCGGHDCSYGPGCISVFGFPKEANTEDMEAVKMVQLNTGDTVTYFGEAVKGFDLNEIQ